MEWTGGLISPDSLIANLMGSNLSPQGNSDSTCVICRRSFGHPKLLQTHLSSHLTGLSVGGGGGRGSTSPRSPRISRDSAESPSTSTSTTASLRHSYSSSSNSSSLNNNNNLLSPGIPNSPRLLSPLSPLSTTSSNNTESIHMSVSMKRDSDEDSLYHISHNNNNNNNNENHNGTKSSMTMYDSNGNQNLLMKVKPELFSCAFCPTVFTEIHGLANHISMNHRQLTMDNSTSQNLHLQSALRLVQQQNPGLPFQVSQHS